MDRLTREDAIEILREASVAHLGMIDENEPYVTPMSFVLEGDRILLRTMAGKKLEALKGNPSVCVEVSTYDDATGDWASVIVNGTAKETNEEDVKTRVVSQLFSKYEKVIGSPLAMGGMRELKGLAHVIVVEIEKVSGMVSGRGWSGRTRSGRM